MLPDGLHKAYNRVRRALLVRGLIALALGIFILARPLESVAAFALVIAVWALVTGIDQIVDGVEMRSVLPHWWLLVLGGVVSVAFGIAAFYYLRLVTSAYTKPSETMPLEPLPAVKAPLLIALLLTVATTLILGIFPGQALGRAKAGAATLYPMTNAPADTAQTR